MSEPPTLLVIEPVEESCGEKTTQGVLRRSIGFTAQRARPAAFDVVALRAQVLHPSRLTFGKIETHGESGQYAVVVVEARIIGTAGPPRVESLIGVAKERGVITRTASN